MKIIFVVACDLYRTSTGTIIVGVETQIACERAIMLSDQESEEHLVVMTAGKAFSRWNGVHMAQVMADYINLRGLKNPRATLFIGNAETFNTWGEMKCLAEIISNTNAVNEIVLAVKWWHAWRCKTLCTYWLKRYNLGDITVKISSCHSHASWFAIAKEFFLSTPKNWFRMVKGKLSY